MWEEFQDNTIKLTVLLNGNVKQSCEIEITTRFTLKELAEEIAKRLKLKNRNKLRLFDATGDELTSNDIEFLKSGQMLFISQGEDFNANSSLALYEFVKQLGEGGFGSVGLYRHRKTKQEYALKFMDAGEGAAQEDIDSMFSEISVLRNFNHPFIIQIFDSFFVDNKVCLVMEYCKGGELTQYIQQQEDKRLKEEDALQFAQQINQAVQYCHQSNIIHRDLKLENLLLIEPNVKHIKLVDFGIAGGFKIGQGPQESDAGSIKYIAPEVINGAADSMSPALDIWSMGCIFYAMLTGDVPFNGETKREIVDKITTVDYQPLDQYFCPSWSVLISKMLDPDPQTRIKINEIDNLLLQIKQELQSQREDPQQQKQKFQWQQEQKNAKLALIEEESKAENQKSKPVKSQTLAKQKSPNKISQAAASPNQKLANKQNNQNPPFKKQSSGKKAKS